MLDVIKKELQKIADGKLTPQELVSTKNYLAGNYLFGFEKKSAYLSNLLHINHRGEDFDTLYRYPKTIRKYRIADISRMIKLAFNWKTMSIVVVGDKKILKQLKQLGPVTTLNYKKYL